MLGVPYIAIALRLAGQLPDTPGCYQVVHLDSLDWDLKNGPASGYVRRSVGPQCDRRGATPLLDPTVDPTTIAGHLEIAIIGGTGLTTLPGFAPIASLPLTHPALTTPWGAPSSPITILSHPRPAPRLPLNVAFLARHGPQHQYAPHEVPSRANIAALRKLGVRCVLAFSAVGSLREEVRPRDMVLPDQVIDRTKGVGGDMPVEIVGKRS